MPTNVIVEQARAFYGDDDPIGTTLSFWFPIANILTDRRVQLPEEWGFQQSILGTDTEDLTYHIILDTIDDLTYDEQNRQLLQAGKILARYTNLLISEEPAY